MTTKDTPPTPAEVAEILDNVENWHDSMPFYNDDLGVLLKEFRRLHALAPTMRAQRDKALQERDKYMKLAQQWRRAALEGVVRDIEGEDE